ncbi:MAG TPA: CHASE domain-containing protein, partial [Azospira sp.]|nr:CHASE domain-containing protein [Azospira sp.]
MPDRPEDHLPPHSLRSRLRALSRWAPLIIFGLSMTLTVGSYLHLRQESRLARQAELVHNGALVAKEIRERLHNHAQNLRGLRAFIAVRGAPSAGEWQAYMDQLDVERNVPGIQAYGYAPKLTAGTASTAAASRTADAAPTAGFSLPIAQVSPNTPANRSALGFDIYSEEYRAAAIDIARDRDDLAITRRIELIQDAGRGAQQAGFLMVLPVYRSGAPIDNVEQRRAALSGVVYAAYRMNDFMHSLGYAGGGLGVRIYDGGPDSATDDELADKLLFDNAGGTWDASAQEDREMSFGSRTWLLRFAPTPRPGLDASELVPWFALVGGSLISLLLGLLSRMQAQSGARAEARAREMTRELRNSEERFQLVAAGTEDGIWDRDLLRGTVWHSDRLKRILGFPPEVDTADVDFFMSRVHADDRPRLTATLERHLRDRQPYVAEYRFLRGDGQLAWLSSRGRGVWDENGRPVRMVGAITDISERKLAETRLDYYRAYLATVLKFLPHPVFVKDRERRYITVSTAFCELVGKHEGEIVGRSDVGDQALPEDLARLARRMDERVLAGEGEQVAEYTLPLVSGQRTVLVRKTLTNDPDGEPIIVGTLTDLTALRAAERERAAADLQRKVILDAATEVSIIATDTQGTIKLFNRGAEKMLGYQ